MLAEKVIQISYPQLALSRNGFNVHCAKQLSGVSGSFVVNDAG